MSETTFYGGVEIELTPKMRAILAELEMRAILAELEESRIRWSSMIDWSSIDLGPNEPFMPWFNAPSYWPLNDGGAE